MEELTHFGGSTLFQEFLSGRREALSFLYAHGDIYARYAFWGKRTNPPLGGIYVTRQSIAVPEDTGEQAERLIREIGSQFCEQRADVDGLWLKAIAALLHLEQVERQIHHVEQPITGALDNRPGRASQEAAPRRRSARQAGLVLLARK